MVRLRDLGTSNVLELRQHELAVTSLASACSSHKQEPLLVSSGLDGLVCIWSLSSVHGQLQVQLVAQLQAHGAAVGASKKAVDAARAADREQEEGRVEHMLQLSRTAALAADAQLVAKQETAKHTQVLRHWKQARNVVSSAVLFAAPVLQGASFMEDAARRIVEQQAAAGVNSKQHVSSFLLATVASEASFSGRHSRGTVHSAHPSCSMLSGPSSRSTESLSSVRGYQPAPAGSLHKPYSAGTGAGEGPQGHPRCTSPFNSGPRVSLTLLQEAAGGRKQARSVSFAPRSTSPLGSRPHSPGHTTVLAALAPAVLPGAQQGPPSPQGPAISPQTSAPTSAYSSRGPSAANSPLPPSHSPMLYEVPAATPEPLLTRPVNAEVLCVVYAPQHEVLVTGGSDGSIKVWSLPGLECRARHTGHQDAVTCLAAAGGMLLSGCEDGSIGMWSMLQPAPGGGACSTAECASGGGTAGPRTGSGGGRRSSGGGGSSSMPSECCVRMLPGHSLAVTALLVMPGGAHVVSCSRDGRLVAWELGSGSMVWQEQQQEELLCLALRQHSGSSELLVGASSGNIYRYPASVVTGRAHRQSSS